MNIPYYKNKKRARRFFREKSGSFNNHDTVPKTAIFKGFSTLSRFWRKSTAGLVTFDHLIWKFSLSVNFPRKPHVQKISGYFFRIFFVWHVGRFEWSIHLLAIFSSLVHQINLILHILEKLNGVDNLATISIMLDYSKIT